MDAPLPPPAPVVVGEGGGLGEELIFGIHVIVSTLTLVLLRIEPLVLKICAVTVTTTTTTTTVTTTTTTGTTGTTTTTAGTTTTTTTTASAAQAAHYFIHPALFDRPDRRLAHLERSVSRNLTPPARSVGCDVARMQHARPVPLLIELAVVEDGVETALLPAIIHEH
jgi:hypothetical protein